MTIYVTVLLIDDSSHDSHYYSHIILVTKPTVFPRHSSNSSQLSDCSMYGTMSQANGQGFMETHGEMDLAIGVMKWSYMGMTKSSKSVRICSDLPSTIIIIWLGNVMTCGWKQGKHAKALIKNQVWHFLEGCLVHEIWASLVQLFHLWSDSLWAEW